jgi:hypothetical protein
MGWAVLLKVRIARSRSGDENRRGLVAREGQVGRVSDVSRMIGRILRTLTNTQCIQATHYVQDAKQQHAAINEDNNEYVKDHGVQSIQSVPNAN